MKKTILLAFCGFAFSATSAQAQIIDGLVDGWVGEGSLTGSRTTGNTETTDIGLGAKLEKETDTWNHKLKGNWDRGSVSGEATRRRFDIGYQIERNLTDRIYLFGNADYYTDDFGPFQDGYFVGAGAGYHVLKEQPFLWDIEGGAGFRSQQGQDFETLDAAGLPTFDVNGDPLFTSGLTDNEFALRALSDIDYQINDLVSLYNDTEFIWSASDTYIWNEVGLTAKLAGSLSARASYRIDHHTDVAPGLVNTDTITRFGIVYTLD